MNDEELGFYTAGKRNSMFPALVYMGSDNEYKIKFTGSAPDRMSFNLRADTSNSGGLLISIEYERSDSFRVGLDQHSIVEPLGFEEGGDK